MDPSGHQYIGGAHVWRNCLVVLNARWDYLWYENTHRHPLVCVNVAGQRILFTSMNFPRLGLPIAQYLEIWETQSNVWERVRDRFDYIIAAGDFVQSTLCLCI